VAPINLRKKLIVSAHGGPLAGHLSNNRLCNLLIQSWWWDGMYADDGKHCSSCTSCSLILGINVVEHTLLSIPNRLA